MLFRLCKVLGQDGLPEALRTYVGEPRGSGGAAFMISGVGGENSQSDNGAKKGSSVFGTDFSLVAHNLAMKTLEAKRTLMEQRRSLTCKRPAKSMNREKNWFTTILVWLLDLSKNQDAENAVELEELDKTVMHIDFCTERLSTFFGLSINVEEVMSSLATSPGFGRDSPVGKRLHEESEPLTPQMRWDIINRTTKYSPKFQSLRNPDEMPLRSDECHFLARLLHKISLAINARFPAIAKRYEEPGVVGAVLRQVCYPPITYTMLTKHSLLRSEHRLPARVVLRDLASYRSLVYLGLVASFCWLFGQRAVLKIGFVIFTLWVVKFFTAVVESKERQSNQ